jgi:hypothetical protein
MLTTRISRTSTTPIRVGNAAEVATRRAYARCRAGLSVRLGRERRASLPLRLPAWLGSQAPKRPDQVVTGLHLESIFAGRPRKNAAELEAGPLSQGSGPFTRVL